MYSFEISRASACILAIVVTAWIGSVCYAKEGRRLRGVVQQRETSIWVDMEPGELVVVGVLNGQQKFAYPMGGIAFASEGPADPGQLRIVIKQPDASPDGKWRLLWGSQGENIAKLRGGPIPGAVNGDAVGYHRVTLPIQESAAEVHLFPFRSVGDTLECIVVAIGTSSDELRTAIGWAEVQHFNWSEPFQEAGFSGDESGGKSVRE